MMKNREMKGTMKGLIKRAGIWYDRRDGVQHDGLQRSEEKERREQQSRV